MKYPPKKNLLADVCNSSSDILRKVEKNPFASLVSAEVEHLDQEFEEIIKYLNKKVDDSV
jgi:hypothetical protein